MKFKLKKDDFIHGVPRNCDYRTAYQNLTTLEEDAVDPDTLERGIVWIEEFLKIAPEGTDRPYLCDAFDGDLDVVWNNKHRTMIICFAVDGTHRGALASKEIHKGSDNMTPEEALEWVRYEAK